MAQSITAGRAGEHTNSVRCAANWNHPGSAPALLLCQPRRSAAVDHIERGAISVGRLINTEQLTKSFRFHGPLNIVHGDGSPVRAYAIV